MKSKKEKKEIKAAFKPFLKKKTPPDVENQRLHNKSNNKLLSVLQWSEEEIQVHEKILDDHSSIKIDSLCETQCELLTNNSNVIIKDGRISFKSKKVFGYEISALRKFGKEQLEEVPSVKNANSLIISHLCGTRNCINPDHLVLEEKRINDERTHCHFCLNNYMAKHDGKKIPIKHNFCPHEPMCGTTAT